VELLGVIVKIIIKKLMMINNNGDEEEGNEEKEGNDEDHDDDEADEATCNKKKAGDAKQEDAVELLERVETLQKQHNGNAEYLGKSLDGEWGYIERYRERTV
jgi:hypothetical protein